MMQQGADIFAKGEIPLYDAYCIHFSLSKYLNQRALLYHTGSQKSSVFEKNIKYLEFVAFCMA
jgi:hypothetical protein